MDLSAWPYLVLSPAATVAMLWGLWKIYLSGYLGEKAKSLARKEDIDKIVAEVRAVTAEQERIRSDIARGLWQYQTALVEKRRSYLGLLNALVDADEARQNYIALQSQSGRTPQELENARQARNSAYASLKKQMIAVEVFGSRDAISINNQFWPQAGDVGAWYDAFLRVVRLELSDGGVGTTQ